MGNHLYSKTKPIMVGGIFLNSLMWITLAAAQPGAVESTTPPVAQAPVVQTTVKTFTVAPVQRGVAILMPNAQTPPPPAALDANLKSGILKKLGGSGNLPAPGEIKAQARPELEHLLLSAQQPFFSDKGLLTLALAYSVHPETGITFNHNYPGSTGVKLKVEKGRTYLLDFAVKSSGEGIYRVETEGGKQAFEDKPATREHLLVALAATRSGWTTVRLNREGSDYHLYYVEITRVN